MVATLETLHLDKRNFVVQWKLVDITTSFIWINIPLTEILNMAVFRIFEVMMGETLNYFVYNAVIMCSVIYL
jgi:hypothetical protein